MRRRFRDLLDPDVFAFLVEVMAADRLMASWHLSELASSLQGLRTSDHPAARKHARDTVAKYMVTPHLIARAVKFISEPTAQI